jgi:hypothetical protein
MLVDLYTIFFRKTLADFYHLDTGAVTSTRLPTGKHTPLGSLPFYLTDAA